MKNDLYLLDAIYRNRHDNFHYLYIANYSILDFSEFSDKNPKFEYIKASTAFIDFEGSSHDEKLNDHMIKPNQLKNLVIYKKLEEIPEKIRHIIFISNIKSLEKKIKKIYKNIICAKYKLVSIDNPLHFLSEETRNKISFFQTISTNYIYFEYFLPEYQYLFGKIIFPDGLLSPKLHELNLDWNIVTKRNAQLILKNRSKYSYKNEFGHAALIGGSKGMIGSILLASKAALKSGCGLVSTILPKCGLIPIQTNIPEIMAVTSGESYLIANEFPTLDKYSAIGIGCGMGQQTLSIKIIRKLLNLQIPLVIDADGLNILSKIERFYEQLPPKTILTPHVGEFTRLFGKAENTESRLLLATKIVNKYDFIIVLKGAHTAIISKDQSLVFNTSGNNGMATAGSGDTLTGIITSLLAQGYEPYNATVLGVYLHGHAGDLALEDERISKASLIASDIIEHLGRAFNSLNNEIK